MRSLFLAAPMLLVLAAPAGAVLTDGPCNDALVVASGPCAPGAPIQMVKTGLVTTDAGELELVAGDIDFVGIGVLSAGDIVTVTTTPLDDPPDFEVPDTMLGVFDSTTDPGGDILCLGDDEANNDLLSCPGEDCVGSGSLCRFTIPAPGNYWVGVAGYRETKPGGCTSGVGGNCDSYPFDGVIRSIPCQEPATPDPDVDVCGFYQVTIGVVPEPGMLLQLVSGLLGLVVLDKRRRGANR
jgi:hypothetical protein